MLHKNQEKPMEDKRLERFKIFENFQNAKLNFFEQKKTNDKKYKKFDDYYSLCVSPKGRNGGISKRLYEVFYGRRIYDSQEQIRSDFSTEKKHLTETGCTLSFGLNDHGYVAIILYPGKTDYTSQIETCIFVKNSIHPKKLLSNKFLEKQWRYLNSYMETTSIDGNPKISDKIRVLYLKNFKNNVIEEKFQGKAINKAIVTTFKFILNIGLSGFLIYLFTVLPNIKTSRDSELIKIENEILKQEKKYSKEKDSLKNLVNIYKLQIKKMNKRDFH